MDASFSASVWRWYCNKTTHFTGSALYGFLPQLIGAFFCAPLAGPLVVLFSAVFRFPRFCIYRSFACKKTSIGIVRRMELSAALEASAAVWVGRGKDA
ncbi:unnamed protein product [Amoebophrya sp. A25]|nr:unnamed protein product [Amoebophrya sp. A25]|eukprot:GSA25T00017053001.1